MSHQRFDTGEIRYHTDQTTESPLAVVELLNVAGWGGMDSDVYAEKVRRSWQFYETVIFAKADGILVGYATAYSDGAFSSGMGELVVHPNYRRRGIGRALMRIVQEKYVGVPFYIKTFQGNEAFFESCGFKLRSNMVVLSKR
jgi:predicted N-acetyltransferase YhbS